MTIAVRLCVPAVDTQIQRHTKSSRITESKARRTLCFPEEPSGSVLLVWFLFDSHSCSPAENPCCIASSMRSAAVVTGVNADRVPGVARDAVARLSSAPAATGRRTCRAAATTRARARRRGRCRRTSRSRSTTRSTASQTSARPIRVLLPCTGHQSKYADESDELAGSSPSMMLRGFLPRPFGSGDAAIVRGRDDGRERRWPRGRIGARQPHGHLAAAAIRPRRIRNRHERLLGLRTAPFASSARPTARPLNHLHAVQQVAAELGRHRVARRAGRCCGPCRSGCPATRRRRRSGRAAARRDRDWPSPDRSTRRGAPASAGRASMHVAGRPGAIDRDVALVERHRAPAEPLTRMVAAGAGSSVKR